jgi:hypothetical protein
LDLFRQLGYSYFFVIFNRFLASQDWAIHTPIRTVCLLAP